MVIVIGTGSSLLFRYRLYKSKIALLADEEILLVQLMKTVQRECFEGNKLSMEEYEEAMAQYEKKLAEAIEERIMYETKLANSLKFQGKKIALNQEKARLIELMKKAQTQYLTEGKLETRIYENMLRSYSSRLSKVEEQISFIDAKEFLGGKGGK